MRRFLISSSGVLNDVVAIKGEEFNHIVKVCRYGPGDEILLTDGRGKEYIGKIKSVGLKDVKVLLLGETKNKYESKLEITLFQSFLKKDKFDFIIQKCTELGIREFVPLLTERCDRKLYGEKTFKRWNKIAESAVCQSGGTYVPIINSPQGLKSALLRTKEFDLNFVFFERSETNEKIRNDLTGGRKYNKVSIWIGPEGGFTKEEIHIFRKNNFKIISLGKRILRAETAAVVASALVLYEFGGE